VLLPWESFFLQVTTILTRGDSVRLKLVYDIYKKYCENEGIKNIEKKTSFRRMLEKNGYRVGKSTTDANQICVFNVELAS